MRTRRADAGLAVALWLLLGGVLALITSQVGDWLDMTDEMRYERLAISIARTHSLVPRVHGVDIESFAQLYPLLVSPAFVRGHVPHNFHVALILNAWIMSSASIPAFLLARRVTGSRRAAVLAALLSVCVPWILYTTMLLTEVAAYPAFVWAFLAIERAIATPSRWNDGFVLLALPLAFFARTALVVLVVVVPVALVAYGLGRRALTAVLRSHPVLVAGYALMAVAAIVLEATGSFTSVFGVYGYYAGNQTLLGHGFAGAVVAHLATFALGIAVLPFLVGAAWLLANVARPSRDPDWHAFACLGSVTVAAMVLQVSAFDLRYDNFVHDRFLIYLAPIVLLATLCALLDVRRPRWSLVLPAVLVALGFLFGAVLSTSWQRGFPIDGDNPAGMFYEPPARLPHGLGGARILLAVSTLLLCALFVLLASRLSHRLFAVGASLVVLAALGAQTAYAFNHLFSVNGQSNRPSTVDMSGAYDWVDRAVGTDSDVAMVPYPVSSDEYVSERAWWDYEFWNKSVDRTVHYPSSDVFEWTGFWFPKLYLGVDRATGRVDIDPAPYALQSVQEARFRLSGTVLEQRPDVVLIRAVRPWRLDWLTTSGLYEDGWTKPGEAVRVRVFAAPGQKDARIRTLTFALRSPDDIPSRPVTITSNAGAWHGAATPATTRQQIQVCVPPRRWSEAEVRTPASSAIPPSQRNGYTWNGPGRVGGLLIDEVALADEIGERCRAGA